MFVTTLNWIIIQQTAKQFQSKTHKSPLKLRSTRPSLSRKWWGRTAQYYKRRRCHTQQHRDNEMSYKNINRSKMYLRKRRAAAGAASKYVHDHSLFRCVHFRFYTHARKFLPVEWNYTRAQCVKIALLHCVLINCSSFFFLI